MYRPTAAAVLALVLFSACASEPEVAGESFDATVCAAGDTVFGIDVSKWQGSIDWSAVAGDGVEYAFIRVSDGLNYPDGQFASNWSGARQNGVLRGAYQFFRPGQDAIAQANMFLDTMGTLEPDDLPPVIDVEASDGQSTTVVAAKIRQWIDHVEAATGRTPIIYTGKYFWQDSVASTEFSTYPLWIAQYGPECPNLPTQWDEWAFFQTGSTGRVAGISGNVDTNLFNGSLADLAAFGAPAVCGDGVCSRGESADSCIADCPPCQLIDATGGIVDDAGPCFEAGGNPDYIRHETRGYGDTLKWTHTTDSDAAANYGLWHLVFAKSGEYRVEAHVSSEFAQSTRARYVVEHGAANDTVTVDQSGTDGWIDLGSFAFAAGGAQWVRLDDNTGEALDTSTRLQFDALRLTRLDPPEDPTTPTGPGGDDNVGGGDDGGSDDSVSGGCAAGRRGGSGPLLGFAFVISIAALRRRR